MASSTYFGRVQRGNRRLGEDLDLLAKWTEAFLTSTSGPSYYLSQLSPQGLKKLFTDPPSQFRIIENADNSVDVESLQDFVHSMDPELRAMMLSTGYERSDARRKQVFGEIAACHSDAETAIEITASEALKNGVDNATAGQYTADVAQAHFDHVAATIRERRKSERDDRLGSFTSRPLKIKTPFEQLSYEELMADAVPSPHWQVLCGKPVAATHTTTATEATFESTKAECGCGVRGMTPKAHDHFTSKTPSHGSETSCESGQWSRPTISPGSASDDESDDDADGGVSLLPKSLAVELGFKEANPFRAEPEARTPTAFMAALHNDGAHAGGGVQVGNEAVRNTHSATVYPVKIHSPDAQYDNQVHTDNGAQDTTAHLGNGLREALASIQDRVSHFLDDPSIHLSHHFNGSPTPRAASPNKTLSIATAPVASTPKKTESSALILATPASKVIQPVAKTTPGPFSASPIEVPFPETPIKPWKGFKCYDVPAGTLGRDQLVPKYWTTRAEKERFLRHKVGDLKLDDAKVRSDRFSGFIARNPIHIFVDLSNIIIGFYDSMKESRGIPITKRVLAPPFSFKNFHTILVRDRNVAKRIVAGSLSNSYNKRWPGYMLQAEELDYEMNILERVPKPVASPVRRRKGKNGNNTPNAPAFDTSGADTSGEDSGANGRVMMKQGEQGVDELLHLKILQSAMDTPEPATMILATGDAASAQYSDGFKKNIERVLALGWNIELYGWSRNISAAWRDPDFTSRWQHQFKIFELDNFCEELYDMCVDDLKP
ncbi:hypothetical protein VTJ04DRAFT_10761 [Mycothermus thermophilus]|uniref:uncharacterized protein n=1 Tax=Humicola insolens TaxID=85995 RepID=UPI0037445DFC